MVNFRNKLSYEKMEANSEILKNLPVNHPSTETYTFHRMQHLSLEHQVQLSPGMATSARSRCKCPEHLPQNSSQIWCHLKITKSTSNGLAAADYTLFIKRRTALPFWGNKTIILKQTSIVNLKCIKIYNYQVDVI